MSFNDVVGLYNYWIVIFLMMTGFYIVLARQNLVKSIIGLNIFQTSVFLLYITMGKVDGGTAPIIPPRLVVEHADGDHHHFRPGIRHGADAPGRAGVVHAVLPRRVTRAVTAGSRQSQVLWQNDAESAPLALP